MTLEDLQKSSTRVARLNIYAAGLGKNRTTTATRKRAAKK